MKKQVTLIVVITVICITAFLAWNRYIVLSTAPAALENISDNHNASTKSPNSTAQLSPKAKREIMLSLPEAHLADNLNAPSNTLLQDVGIVCSMLSAWRSIYRKTGNPVGNNQDLVRALLGDNPNAIIFLRQDNPAINKNGELCDRYGHPFFFHAESGTRMEVRSAGPDGVLFTPDDVHFSP
jgi:hypothetical protein